MMTHSSSSRPLDPRRARALVTAGLAAVLALASPLDAAATAGASPASVSGSGTELEAFFDDVVPGQLEELRIAGAAVSVVRDGEVVLAKGYGYADVERHMAMDGERSLSRPGSASKPITWTAVMQLVEKGRIDLDADVNRYLDFRIPERDDGPLTMRHLLTHTSGFEAVESDLFILDEARVPELRDYLVRRMPARIFPAGAVAGYSNYGTALAGYIVGRVSGEPFDEYVRKHIFVPLEMRRSTFSQPVPADLASDVVVGYGSQDGRFVRGDHEYVGPYPAGGANVSAADMARFMAAHLGGGSYGGARILATDTVTAMHRRQFSPDDRLDKMALGFMERTVNDRRMLWHGGATFLHTSGLYLLPEEKDGLFVSYNGKGGAEASEALLQAFMDRYYPAGKPLAALKPKPGAEKRLARYAGEYHFTRSEFTTSGKFVRLLMAAQVKASSDGKLLLTVEGKTQPYVELGGGLFRHESRDELLLFRPDENGRMWIHSDGAPSHPSFIATSAFRVPWYQSSSTTALVLLSGLLLFAASLIAWAIDAIVARLRSRPHRRLSGVARGLAASFGTLLVLFMIALLATVGDIHPAYGVPRAFVGEATPLLDAAMWFPLAMAPLSLAMTALLVLSRLATGEDGRPEWGLAGRIHYAALTLSAITIVSALYFWNLTALTN